MLRRRPQANVLAIVVAILFILVTVVMALHQSQARAVRNVTQAEAELQFRQGFEFEVAKLLATEGPLPAWVKVSGESELVAENRVPTQYAKHIWEPDKLPNLDPAESKDHAAGHHTYKIVPDTNDATLKVFGQRHKWLVTYDSAAYAAYAPEGKITLSEIVGWANPTFDDKRKSTEAYSGVQAVVACKSDLEIEKMRYGQAYSLDGPITLGSDSEGAYGFQGSFPARTFDTDLGTKLDTLKSSFQSAARSGNKTSSISGGVLSTVGTMFELLFTGGSAKEPGLSLEQAWQVPFPMIPGFSNTVPGIFYEFWLHMPYVPDTKSFSGDNGASEEQTKKIKELNDKIEKLNDEIDGTLISRGKPSLGKDKDGNPVVSTSASRKSDGLKHKVRRATGDKKKQLQKKLREKRAERTRHYNKIKDIRDDLKKRSKENEKKVKESTRNGSPDEPSTRRDDKDIDGKRGIIGWAYGKIFENLLGVLWDIISGDFENIANRFSNTVRVVHFGRKDNEPEFGFENGGWQLTATFTVPPGRTFMFDGNMEITGDLWLQKGTAMYVGGDLELVNPNDGSLNPLKPSGKLVIEEGATLVVDGDLTCAGQTQYGSLWVSSPPGRLAPITSAILVKGKADFPNGSYSATNLEDAVRWLVDKGDASALKDVPDVVATITNKVAPNLSKVIGPFHIRKPFFASYASTFQLTMVPTPIGQIPVPTVIPLPRKNILVPIFRAFSYVYTPAMNFSLGENLYTHADWWGFGDGVVPVVVKIDPERMLRGLSGVNLGGLSLDSIDWEDYLQDVQNKVLEGAMKFVIETVAKAVIKEVINAAIPGGGLATIVLDQVFDAINLKDDTLKQLQKTVLDATLGPITSELERWVDGIRTQVEDGIADGYLRAITGPLIYADTITAGDGNTRLFAGLLVARNNISIDTRTFVGSLTSLKGNITAQRVYYNQHFTYASLYKPKATKTNFVERGLQFEYGSDFKSTTALDFNTGIRRVSTEAWSQ